MTIHDAVAAGLPVDLSLLRSGVDDEETWLQEFECAFLSDAQNYIPMELIWSCVHEGATVEVGARHPSSHAQDGERQSNRGMPLQSYDPPVAAATRAGSHGPDVSGPWALSETHDESKSKFVAVRLAHGPEQSRRVATHAELYLGVDIGRKRDLTVMWLFEKLGDVMWSRALLTLKGQTFDRQEKAFDDLMALGVRRCGIDASGLGMMLAERAQKKYGARVEPVQFTGQVKEKLAPMVKQAFEDRLVRIPDNREVRADLNAVKRFVTPGGNIRFDADRTEKGHADRFWALALALDAASAAPSAFIDTVEAETNWYRTEARGVRHPVETFRRNVSTPRGRDLWR